MLHDNEISMAHQISTGTAESSSELCNSNSYPWKDYPMLIAISDELLTLIFARMVLRGRTICRTMRTQMFRSGSPDDPITFRLDLRGTEDACGELIFLKNFDHLAITVTTDRVGPFFSKTMLQLSEINFKATREIKVRGNWVGTDGVEHLAHGLQCLPLLQTLDLSGNGLGRSVRGVEHLSNGLKVLTLLTSLHVRDNFLGLDGAAQLSSGLAQLSKLTLLDIGYNNIGAGGAGFIADAFGFTRSLTFVDLRDNQLMAEGVAQISRSCEHLLKLNTLILGHNDLGAAGAEHLSHGLKHLTSLTVINIRDNHLGQSGAEQLARGLEKVPNIADIDVGWNELRRSGAVHIADALASKGSLTTVNMEGNRIGSSGAEYVATTLRHLRSLKCINFRSPAAAPVDAFCVHAFHITRTFILMRSGIDCACAAGRCADWGGCRSNGIHGVGEAALAR